MQSISESIGLSVSEDLAFKILSDLNLILRLSPYWSLKKFTPLSNGKFEATIEYYGKNITETHAIETADFLINKRISFRVGSGGLKEIRFLIEKNSGGIQLTQQFLLELEDETVLKETQNELHFWLRSIGEYLKLSGRKTLWPRFFKWFMDKAWLKLTLSERKIAMIIIAISVIELVILLVMVIIWNLFAQ